MKIENLRVTKVLESSKIAFQQRPQSGFKRPDDGKNKKQEQSFQDLFSEAVKRIDKKI